MLLTALLLTAALQTATVTGRVTDAESGSGIAGATVFLGEGIDAHARTDSLGDFTFRSVPLGPRTLTVRALGFDPSYTTIVVAPGQTRADIALRRVPYVLPRVVVRGAPSAETERDRLATYGPPPIAVSGAVLRAVPGLAQPDVLRAMQLLPGVSATSDYSSAPLVRGGSADQTLVTLDGVPLFNPYRFGGFFSAINPAVVGDANVYTGAMPAAVGDRLSGAIALRTRESPRDRLRVGGSLGMIGTTADLETPLFDGRGDALLAGRYHYIGRLAGRGSETTHGAWDLFGRLTRDVRASENISAWILLDQETIDRPTFGLSRWGSAIISGAYSHADVAGMELNVRATSSRFDGLFDISEDRVTEVMDSRVHDMQLAATATRRGRAHRVTVGLQLDRVEREQRVTVMPAVIRDPLRPSLQLFVPLEEEGTSLDVVLHAEDQWQVTPRLGARLGVRALNASGLGSALMPRGGVRYSLNEVVDFTLGGGSYAQPFQTLLDDESVFGNILTAELLTRSSGTLARGHDLGAGVEWRDGGFSLRAESYIKWQRRLWLRDRRLTQIAPAIHEDRELGSMLVQGVELSAGLRRERFELLGSYSASRARRRTGDVEYVPRPHRSHFVDALLLYRTRGRTMLSLRTMAASGQPYTPGIGAAIPAWYDAWQQTWIVGAGGSITLLGEHNSARTRAYFRLDGGIRREYRRRWGGRDMTFTPFLQVLNLTNMRNEVLRVPNIDGGLPERFSVPQLPVVPTIGLEWRF